MRLGILSYIALQHQQSVSHGCWHTGENDMIVTMIISEFGRWFRYRETVRELSRMSDRQLLDLGVARKEIMFAAMKSVYTA
jgi:uncharacterized protein YjiS (DUF1127 family)